MKRERANRGGEYRKEGAVGKEECKNRGNTKKRVENNTSQKTSKESKGKSRVEPKQRVPHNSKRSQVETKTSIRSAECKKKNKDKKRNTHSSLMSQTSQCENVITSSQSAVPRSTQPPSSIVAIDFWRRAVFLLSFWDDFAL